MAEPDPQKPEQEPQVEPAGAVGPPITEKSSGGVQGSLEAILRQGASDDLVAALDFVLLQSPGPDQLSHAIEAAASLVTSDDAFDLVMWFARLPRLDRFEVITEAKLTPEVDSLARRIAMRHASLLRTAWHAWEYYPDTNDWDGVIHQVAFSPEDDEYTITLSIRKRNGERFQITGSQDSIMRLATRVLGALEEVEDASVFDGEDAAALYARVDGLRATLNQAAQTAHPEAEGDESG